MPRRSEKVLYNKKTDRSIPLNRNACDQKSNTITSHIESIGNLIINELKGSERDRLKHQLVNSCVSHITTNSNLPLSSSRRSLKQVLDDLHTFDCLNERQYRTIGIGDNDVNANMMNNDLEIPKHKTRRTSFEDSPQTIDNKKKKTPNIVTRTICTRSSKLNTLNNNQEQINNIDNMTKKSTGI